MTETEAMGRPARVVARLRDKELSDQDRKWCMAGGCRRPRRLTYIALLSCFVLTAVGLYSYELPSFGAAFAAFAILALVFVGPLAFIWMRCHLELLRLLASLVVGEARVLQVVEYRRLGYTNMRVDFAESPQAGAPSRLRADFGHDFPNTVGDTVPMLSSTDPRVKVRLVLAGQVPIPVVSVR